MSSTGSGSKLIRQLVLNSYKKQLEKQMREKFAKKGLLTKLLQSNKKRTDTLVEILKLSNDFNTSNMSSSSSSSSSSNESKTDDEYLKKFHNTFKGGPKHSIAVTRAHHLTNFLSEYIINAFQSARFDLPEIPEHFYSNNDQIDMNGFKKDKFFFEISNIELLCDLTALNIRWYSSDNEQINQFVEDYLEKNLTSQIRNCLINERVMSYVPKVVFIRDETRVLMNKLDEYLMKINLENKNNHDDVDYGDDDEDDDENKNDSSTMTCSNDSEKNNLNKLNSNSSNENEDETTNKKFDQKLKTIDNLYGVNFTNLIESIKKAQNSTDYKLYEPESDQNSFVQIDKQENEVSALVKSETVETYSSNEFEKKLKSFEINKRLKYKRLSKSAINKLAYLEIEELRQENKI